MDKLTQTVILNEVKNLIKSMYYETLRFAQGDKMGCFSAGSFMIIEKEG